MNAGIFPDDEKKFGAKISAAAVKLNISLNFKEHVSPGERRQILVIKNVVTFSFGTKSGVKSRTLLRSAASQRATAFSVQTGQSPLKLQWC